MDAKYIQTIMSFMHDGWIDFYYPFSVVVTEYMDDRLGMYDRYNDRCLLVDDFGNLVPVRWNGIDIYFQDGII